MSWSVVHDPASGEEARPVETGLSESCFAALCRFGELEPTVFASSARSGSFPRKEKRAAVELLRTHPLRPRRFGEGHSSESVDSPTGAELVVSLRDRAGGPRTEREPSAYCGDPGRGELGADRT
jgi:hypothetical protein